MREGKKMSTKKSGFTLVEILIVVVILGILAAIVIPHFTSASKKAKEANLVSNLQAVRSQIELYKIQHNDELPGTQGVVDFTTAMTSLTDKFGVVQAVAGAGIYGPYMQRIPKNPFGPTNLENTVETDGVVGGDSHGWHYTTAAGLTRGLFQADDSGNNALDGGTLHIDY